jgi:hypothetical protein
MRASAEAVEATDDAPFIPRFVHRNEETIPVALIDGR